MATHSSLHRGAHPGFGAAYMVGAGAVFALTNTLVQYLTMMRGAGAPSVAFGQYLAAAVLFAPWIIGHARGAWRTKRPLAHALRVALPAIGVQLWVWGLGHVPIWQAIALIMLSPVFVTLGARLWLGEDVGPERWLAVLGGLLGGALILAPWSDSFTPYALLPVGAAAFWASVSLMTKDMSATEAPESLTFWLLVGLIPINALVLMGQGGALPDGVGLGLIAVAGGLTALAQYLIARAYGAADAAFLQPFDHLKLLFNVGLGALAFGFLPPGRLWLGAALIVAASMFLLGREAPETD